jgi:FixJ family two-component response regulator
MDVTTVVIVPGPAANMMRGLSEATCLVVDVQLGDLSGVELARQLVADGFKYPIIFMTALDDARIQSQAEAAGAVAYLCKPFRPNLLIDAIIEAIGEPYGFIGFK